MNLFVLSIQKLRSIFAGGLFRVEKAIFLLILLSFRYPRWLIADAVNPKIGVKNRKRNFNKCMFWCRKWFSPVFYNQRSLSDALSTSCFFSARELVPVAQSNNWAPALHDLSLTLDIGFPYHMGNSPASCKFSKFQITVVNPKVWSKGFLISRLEIFIS